MNAPSWVDGVTGRGHIKVEPVEWLALEFLCFNMRAIDRKEVYGNLATDNPIEWAAMMHQALARNGCGWVGRLDGRPAAFIGIFEQWPGNWQITSFGTNDYKRVLVALRSKWDLMKVYLREHGGHRLECRSLASHVEAHGFLKLMGFECEARLHQYGRHGEDYLQFAQLWEVQHETSAQGLVQAQGAS